MTSFMTEWAEMVGIFFSSVYGFRHLSIKNGYLSNFFPF